MEFCCSINELSNFSYSSKEKKIVANDYVDLKSDNVFSQPEFDFEFYAKLEAENKAKKQSANSKPTKVSLKDRNIELMTKYKYDEITDEELNEFYCNIEKLIYKIIKNNYVTESFGDICNEIWKRIAKYRNNWDETKGVCVSTWVGKVAINVIQTFRKRSMTYRARNVSLDGMVAFGKGGEEIPLDVENLIAENKDNSGEKRNLFYKNIVDCFDVFNDTEKQIVELFLNDEPETLFLEDENRVYKRKYASATFVRKKLSLTQTEYNKCIKSIGEKYVARQKENPNDGIDYRVLYRVL